MSKPGLLAFVGMLLVLSVVFALGFGFLPIYIAFMA